MTQNKSLRIIHSPCIYGIVIFFLTMVTSTLGDNGSWTSTLAGLWSVPGNWSAGTIADGAGFTGWITNNIGTARTITVNTNSRSLGTLHIGDADTTVAFTLAALGGATFSFNNSGANAHLNQTGTSKGDILNSTLPLMLVDSLDISNASANALTLAGPIANAGAGIRTISNVGAGTLAISGIISNGAGTVAVVQDNPNGLLTLSGANTFTGGVFVKAGTVSGITSVTAFGSNTSVITLGDASGSANVTLSGGQAATYTNPIVVAAGNTGIVTITNSAASVFSGMITLNSHGLTISPAGSSLTFRGGVTGTGNLALVTRAAGNIMLSTSVVDIAGTITNSGAGTGDATISGGVGSNVTAITENSAGSALTINTNALTVNISGTTLANNMSGTTAKLTLSGGVRGVGNLVLNNNSDLADGITVSTLGVTNYGTVVNSGTGSGSTLISATIGTNVTAVIQNSTNSQLTLSSTNTFTNGLIIKAGIVKGTLFGALGAVTNVVTLGDSSGSANVMLWGAYLGTYSNPISVAAGNTGIAMISNSVNSSYNGPITLNSHDLSVAFYFSAAPLVFRGNVTGTGNLLLLPNGGITFSNVNNIGTITDASPISNANAVVRIGDIGSNITAIIENTIGSAVSVMNIGGSLTVNSNGTTIANNNPGGSSVLELSGNVTGVGNLIISNNSAIADGILLSGTTVNNMGAITNSGTGPGSTRIDADIGANVSRVVQASANSILTLSGTSSYTNGLFIKAGTVKGLVSINAFGADTNLITIGDTSGSANATLRSDLYSDYPQPIAIASNNTGIATIRADNNCEFSGPVMMTDHDLTLSVPAPPASGAGLTISGGITGRGNVTLFVADLNGRVGAITLSGLPIDNTGTVTNTGTGTGDVKIKGGVGTNVTAITQASTNSALIIDTESIMVNSGGTTLINESPGNAKLTGQYVGGTGDLILKNNTAIPEGITFSVRNITNIGRVFNSGTGTGSTLISAVIGANVTRVVQNSATSRLILSGAATYAGDTAIDSGTLQVSNNTGSATGTGAVNVNNGGTLQGDGTISGTVSNNNGGTISPGLDGVAGGILTVGNLAWNGGGVYHCEVASIDAEGIGAGVDYDQIVVTGTLTGASGVILRMDSLGHILDFQTNRNYGLKVITCGAGATLNPVDVTLETNEFLGIGGTWMVTNLNKSIYVVCMGASSTNNRNFWTGTGTWSTATNWSLGHAPLAGEDVEFDFRNVANCRADIVSNNIGSLTLSAGYTGTVTFLTKYPGKGSFTNVAIAGDCAINGGTLTHLTNSGATAEADWLSISVGGNLTVGPAGSINVDQKGFAARQGPAAGISRTGAGHGGHGAPGSNWTTPSNTYGSIFAPTNLGSGGLGKGGGCIRLDVTSTTRVDGVIQAAGVTGADDSSSAGGSIYISTGWLTGEGELNVQGGASSTAGGASGGGRIAVVLRNGTDFGDWSRFKAFGNTCSLMSSAAGTVYLQAAGQNEGEGILIVNNNNLTSSTNLTASTPWFLCTLVPDAGPRNGNHDLSHLSALVVTNGGILGINTNTIFNFGTVPIHGAGASVVTNWRTAASAPAAGVIALRGTNFVTFPEPFVISNYSLCLDVPVSRTGNWIVAASGSLSHSGHRNPTPGQEEFRLRLELFGNLTVEAGGAIEANAKGYYPQNGPAPGQPGKTYPMAAGHGGRGSTVSTGGTQPSNTYGSVTSPRTLGSGGDSHAGSGSIELVVHGTTTVHGVISARPPLPGAYQSSGAAGGSIYLRTGWLAGAGNLDAQGGSGSGGGGGGRIAVILTGSESFDEVSMSAAGTTGGNCSGPGTVYLERASESGGHGMLTFDNAGVTIAYTNSSSQLPAPAYAVVGELTPVTLMVTNRAQVALTTNLTMKNLFLYTNSVLYLKGYTLTLNSAYHEDWGNSNWVVYDNGQIIWNPRASGMVITFY